MKRGAIECYFSFEDIYSALVENDFYFGVRKRKIWPVMYFAGSESR